jgi:hypothetical protein
MYGLQLNRHPVKKYLLLDPGFRRGDEELARRDEVLRGVGALAPTPLSLYRPYISEFFSSSAK